ncbi:hypothetical protein BY458DRAFT_508963 [Sporodiniella umbellata]|nr:hypothetical protein BY458DRAFT_508963 [Sporodiniella umbellata]
MFDLDDPGNEPVSMGLPKTSSWQLREEHPTSPSDPTLQATQPEQWMQSVEIIIEQANDNAEAAVENATPSQPTALSSDQDKPPDVLQSLESLAISDEASEELSVEPRPRISLRKRKQIQLHPFTIEKYKFKSMLHGTSVRRLVSVADPLSTQDPTDTEFVPGTLEEDPFDFETQPITRTEALAQENSSQKSSALHGKKLITYSKRKRDRISTPKEPCLSDIFAFDPNPSFSKTNSGGIDAILGEFEDILSEKVQPRNKTDSLDNDAHMSVDDESDEDEPVYFRHKRLRRRIDTDDDNDDQEEEKDDSIFDFPQHFDTEDYPTLRRSDMPEDKHRVVIQHDDLEHRPTKRRRNRMADLRQNKNMLKGVLPASFLNVYQKELNEEERARMENSKRTVTSIKGKKPERKVNRLDEPFDAFLGSQTSYLQNDESKLKSNGLFLGDTDDEPPQTSIFNFKPAETASYTTPILQPRIDNATRHYESVEDNRVFQHGSTLSKRAAQPRINRYFSSHNGTSSNRVQNPSKTSIPKATKKQVPQSVYSSSSKPPQRASKAGAKLNKKKRKIRKRTMDDIYIHQYHHHVRPRADSPSIAKVCSNRTLDDSAIFSKRIYNDDHMTVQKPPVVQWVRDMAEFLRSTKNAASLNPLPKYTQSLEQIVEQLQRVFDPDLRCTTRVTDTVYLHHRLLQPLLSTQPNAKRAYAHLKAKLEQPCVFSRNLIWTSIYHRRSHIQSLFQCAAREVVKAGTDLNSEPTDIPDLDTFYTFVSVYLTQWLPLQDPAHVITMTEVFGQEVREMAHRMHHTVSTQPIGSWRLIVKTMLFVLDWTCRLHLIGINPEEWSVTRCTQILINILVTIGYACITTREKPFVIEAWVCLFQVMTVSSNSGGYYFSDQSLIQQFRNAINQRSNKVGWIDQGTSIETCWTHAFQHILEKYM